ncbi:MAG: TIM barrel protein [Chloroflexi bacterium]|nr:TIM barrel protein [Chloroflexota bacterium]
MRWKVGHTGITWPSGIEDAVRDTAGLGYQAFETMGRTVEDWQQKPGGFRALLDRYDVAMMAIYCYGDWVGGADAEEVAVAVRQAQLLKDLGGEMVVIAGRRRPKGGCTSEQFRELAAAFDEVGRRCQDLGLRVALHPHTQTQIETAADIRTIFDLVDPRLVQFAPDTGQIAKGGSDIVQVFETYSGLIKHVHLKDWCGQVAYDADGKEVDYSGYVNYEPVGNGVLPIPKLLALLEGAGYDGWLAVELDGTPRSPRPPREAAAMSRRYLGQLLGDQVAWRRDG